MAAVTDLVLSRLARTMQTIFRIGNINIKDSSGVVQLRDSADAAYADARVKALVLSGTNATNAFTLQVPTLSGALSLTLPSAAGSSGQVLRNDGSGGLSWVDVSANSQLSQEEAFTQTSGTLTVFTSPPANAKVVRIVIQVTSAASGGSPTITVGVAGTVDQYVAATEVDLKTLGTYEIPMSYDMGGSPANIIATITASAQTFTGLIRIDYVTAS